MHTNERKYLRLHAQDASTQQPAQKRPPLWRNYNYLLFWSGQTISDIGGGISLVAFPLLALAMSGSPIVAATAGMRRTLPNSLYLVSSAMVDHWNRKYVMIICDSGRMLSLASIPLALLLGHLTLWQLFLNVFVEGTLLVFFSIAHASSLGQLVSGTQIPLAMAQEEVVEGVTGLLGPASQALYLCWDACCRLLQMRSLSQWDEPLFSYAG